MSEDSNVLQHHGVRGQKWGVRRYQNKDGTLTAAGRRREGLPEKDSKQNNNKFVRTTMSKKTSKTGSAVNKSSTKTKSVKDMSDDEIRNKINRMRLEEEYENYNKKSEPKPVLSKADRRKQKGKAIAKTVMKDVVAPAAINVGKQLVTSFLAKQANKRFKLDGTEYKVYTNNKKKD